MMILHGILYIEVWIILSNHAGHIFRWRSALAADFVDGVDEIIHFICRLLFLGAA